MIKGALPVAVLAALAAGCTGPQRILDARGPAAERIAELWWVLFGFATAVCVVVIVLLLFAALRGRARARGAAAAEIDGRLLVWAGGVLVPAAILFTVLIYSYRVGHDIYPPLAADGEPLTIVVTGHQYWWEVEYPSLGIVSANEIHLPAGRPVRFLITAPDVIHSFWIPQLHGKIDMIPGRRHELWVTVDEPGEYRGQCAEYCGLSHALMAFWAIVHEATDFERWVRSRAAGDTTPTGPLVLAGREIFIRESCGDCHAVPGLETPDVFGSPGPPLHDLATRRTIAAGTLPNDAAALHAWVAAPERIKPGVRMPPTDLAEPEMRALLAYLQSLD